MNVGGTGVDVGRFRVNVHAQKCECKLELPRECQNLWKVDVSR